MSFFARFFANSHFSHPNRDISPQKIGEALQITDSDASLYTDVDETAGMGLAMQYEIALIFFLVFWPPCLTFG